jgi:antitoxin HigA-1
MEELHISARTLSIETGIPESNMSQILKGKRSITAHISLRLGKLFQLNEEYFLTIQNHYDLTKEKIENWEKLCKIHPYHKLQKSA